MNPILYKNGPFELHAFTGWIMLGVAISIAILLLTARHQRPARYGAWIDCAIGAVIGGVIGARLGHVWLNWVYFSVHTDQITSLQNGGLDWHGAVVVGLLAVILVAWVRRVPMAALLDALAWALPFGAISIWLACTSAGAAYGLEVRTLADFPSWLVIESPDVYGSIAPRLNLAPAGIILALLVLMIVLLLTALKRYPGLRVWPALMIYSLGMAFIDFFRADYVPIWFDRRADQVLDLALVFVALLIFAIFIFARPALRLWRQRAERRLAAQAQTQVHIPGV